MKLSRAFVTNRSSLSFSLNAERVVANLSGKTRRASLNGRQFIVAPVTLIVTGVLNGSKGPLFYPPEEIERDYEAWNHIPIVLGHPEENGEPVSARTPHILERLQMGYVFNVRFVDGKLVGEGWFDTEKTRSVSELVLANLNAGKRIELSTGLFTDNEEIKGDYNGRPYDFIARNYRPDHLAILLDQEGACSIADGCGVLVNKKYGKSSVGPKLYSLINNANKDLINKVDVIDGLIAKAEQLGKAADPVSRMADKLGTPDAHKEAYRLIAPIVPLAEKAMGMIADLAKNSGTNEGNVFKLMADAAIQIRGWAYDGLRHHKGRALGRALKSAFDKVRNSSGTQIQMTGITTGIPERANSTVLDHIAKNRKRKPKMNTRRKPVRNGDGLLQTKLKAEIEWLKAKLARLDRSRNTALRESVYGDLLDKMRQLDLTKLKTRMPVGNSGDQLARKIALTVNFKVYFNRREGKYKLYNNYGALVLESANYAAIRRAALKEAGANILSKSVASGLSTGSFSYLMDKMGDSGGGYVPSRATRDHAVAGAIFGGLGGAWQSGKNLYDMRQVKKAVQRRQANNATKAPFFSKKNLWSDKRKQQYKTATKEAAKFGAGAAAGRYIPEAGGYAGGKVGGAIGGFIGGAIGTPFRRRHLGRAIGEGIGTIGGGFFGEVGAAGQVSKYTEKYLGPSGRIGASVGYLSSLLKPGRIAKAATRGAAPNADRYFGKHEGMSGARKAREKAQQQRSSYRSQRDAPPPPKQRGARPVAEAMKGYAGKDRAKAVYEHVKKYGADASFPHMWKAMTPEERAMFTDMQVRGKVDNVRRHHILRAAWDGRGNWVMNSRGNFQFETR